MNRGDSPVLRLMERIFASMISDIPQYSSQLLIERGVSSGVGDGSGVSPGVHTGRRVGVVV